MKIICDKSLLIEAVSTAMKASLAKSTIPSLEGILIVTEENSIKVSCYDLNLGIECELEAQIITPGSIVLNSRIFNEIIRKLPDENISITVDERLLAVIKGGLSEFTILGTPASDFPEIPKVEDGKSLNLKQDILKSMISQTIFAVSVSDNRPVLTGSLFDIAGDSLKVVSVDGFRLALREESISNTTGQDKLSFIVPGKTLTEISKILRDTDDEVSITISRKHILFSFDRITLVSRLIDGDFLNYDNVIPKESKVTAVIDVRKLIDSFERATLLINEKIKSPVICTFDYDTVRINCKTSMGNVYDEISSKITGETLEIGVNNRYMLDALRACGHDTVIFEMSSSLSPIVIRPIEGNEFTFIVVPMRYRADD